MRRSRPSPASGSAGKAHAYWGALGATAGTSSITATGRPCGRWPWILRCEWSGDALRGSSGRDLLPQGGVKIIFFLSCWSARPPFSGEEGGIQSLPPKDRVGVERAVLLADRFFFKKLSRMAFREALVKSKERLICTLWHSVEGC